MSSSNIIYRNGNYYVVINSENGTKKRLSNNKILIADYPESIDFKITNYCTQNCRFCHEISSTEGKAGDINFILKIIDNLKPYTELAIGGGDPLSHPNIIEILKFCKEKKIFANMTIHSNEIENINDEVIENVNALGISVLPYAQYNDINNFPNVILHTIAGIWSYKDYQTWFEKYPNSKFLILGYKNYGKGITYNSINIQKNIEELNEKFMYLPFPKVISFDNLAVEQLNMKDKIDDFDTLYLGNDGEFTMYIDAVKQEYAKNSTSDIRFKF